jgi:hypothetical protein
MEMSSAGRHSRTLCIHSFLIEEIVVTPEHGLFTGYQGIVTGTDMQQFN